jgi:hypothetical protein
MTACASRFGRRSRFLVCAIMVGCSSRGGEGPPGPEGEAGAQGPPFQLAGTIAGTVTAAATGKLLGATAVTEDPGSVTATTGGDGTFNMTLPVGAYGLTFKRQGYLDKTVPGVDVTLAGTTHIAVTMATDPTTDGPTIAVSDNLTAGFDSPVTVTAQVTAPDSDPTKLVYGWTQTGGLPAAGLTGTSTDAITFTTLKLSDAKLEANSNVVLGEHDGGLVPARFGAMSFSPDETGNYAFTFTATDPEGHVASTAILVQATPPSSGLRNVPVGIPVWFEGDSFGADGGPQTAWSWSLDTSEAPGSKATLAGATTQFPSMLPDVSGTYALTESVSGKSANVYAHDWDGISGGDAGVGNDYVEQGCTTAGCHVGPTSIPWPGTEPLAPDMFTPWRTTAHATTFANELDGVTPGANASCVECHTVGYTTFPPAVNNGGFGDVAQQDSWTFPASPEAGVWDDLVASQPDLAQLGNVQCESCHGPMNTRLMLGVSPETAADGGADNIAAWSFGSGVCGQCHGQAAAYPKLEQWKQSPHANLALSAEVGTVDARGTGADHCARCHSAQGYSQYSQQLAAGYTGYLTSDGLPAALDGGAGADGGPTQTNAATVQSLSSLGLTRAVVQPQTCAACHDPHAVAGNPFQLRLYDSLPGGLPNGQGPISGVGAGAVCMACHNQRNGTLGALSLASNPTSIPTPHDGPQTDVLFGVNAFFMPPANPSPHLAVKDTCAGCHYGVPTAAQRALGETQNHSFVTDTTICGTCHGSADGGPDLVDGLALQGQVKTQMVAMDQLLFAKVADAFGSAASGGYTVTSAQDTSTGSYLCAAAGTGTPSFTFTVGPTAADITEPQPPQEWRALTTLWITFPTLAGTPECTSAGALATTTYSGTTPVSVSLNGTKSGSSTSPVFPPGSIVAQCIWNEALLHDDQTWGIHNPSFFVNVIESSMAQLNTLP